jgi:F-type H+-transporting ATPase subunit gamma
MEEVERARERLENIRSVKPILNGLRTISLGSWQAALKRRGSVQSYAEQLKAMLPPVIAHLPDEDGVFDRLRERFSHPGRFWDRPESDEERKARPACSEVLVVGSERGLCGRFNVAVADKLDHHLRQSLEDTDQVSLRVLGSRAGRVLRRRGYEPTSAGTLAVTTLPPLSLAFDMSCEWLSSYERHALDTVIIVFNDYRGTGNYEPTVTQLVPPRFSVDDMPSAGRASGSASASWPPPIVDTDPKGLYATIIEQWTAVKLYSILLDSSAAEHSTRFQLMESATQNADQLVEDLTLVIQTARRQAITQEMAELAAGAGLLRKE